VVVGGGQWWLMVVGGGQWWLVVVGVFTHAESMLSPWV